MSAENVETVRVAYEAFGHGDLGTVGSHFAEDAEWETSDSLPLGGLVRGRDAILGFFRGVGGDVVTTAPPGRMQHHVSSVRVAVESSTAATATCYFTVMTGAGVDHWGRYKDRLVPAPDGDRWVFAHRLVRTDGRTPGGWADTR